MCVRDKNNGAAKEYKDILSFDKKRTPTFFDRMENRDEKKTIQFLRHFRRDFLKFAKSCEFYCKN